jgi:hypothetical protein
MNWDELHVAIRQNRLNRSTPGVSSGNPSGKAILTERIVAIRLTANCVSHVASTMLAASDLLKNIHVYLCLVILSSLAATYQRAGDFAGDDANELRALC